MNIRPTILAAAILGAHFAAAQNVSEEPQADPVLDAIQDFQNRDKSKPNEVTVVLAPPTDSASQEEKEDPVSAEPESAVLVTGNPQEVAEPEAAVAESGLAVRVEKMQAGKGSVDPSKVKLLAPFPAKPLAQPPAGWRLDASDSAPPFTREVEIASGSTITLSIRPHLLIPDADGSNVFTISEPGYDNALGYQQTATVGAILSNSIRQMDEESQHLGAAIDRLQQLLISLPKPEPQQEVKPATLRKK